ncbi:MAG: sugar phosphate nucleotidyltransferase [Spirochaetota bacterium]
MKPALLILAAGMGSRYGGLKQIDPVGENGETIIDFSVYDAIKSGFSAAVFVIRKDIEKEFRDIIGKKFEKRINVDYVFQKLDDIPANFKVPDNRTKPWGTGQAILCAHSVIKTPFAVINGDDFYGRDSFQVLSDFLTNTDPKSNEYAIAAYILQNTLSEHGYVSRGVCSLENDNYLKNITEYTKIKKQGEKVLSSDESGVKHEFSGAEFVSMNMFGFTPGIFDHLQQQFHDFLQNKADDLKAEFFIPSVVSNLIQSKQAKVRVLQSNSVWLGITYQEDKEFVKERIKELINKGVYPKSLWN